jgi:tetratricopeptide (TPR) repeat protein
VTCRFVSIWFLASLAVLGFACASSEETLKRHLERAEAYQDSSQPEKALVELQAALKLAPQRSDTNLRLAELLEDEEHWEEALYYYEEARRLDPKSDEAALGVGRLIRFNEPDRADELINEVLGRNPQSARAHVLRSDILLVRNDLNGALASALTAAELDPKSPRVALQVAMARKAFIAERRLKKEPDDPKLFEAADAAFAHAIELAKAEPYWMVRGAIERARLGIVRSGYGPKQIEIYQTAFADLKGYPILQTRIAAASAEHARLADDPEFLLWALSRRVEVDPTSYPSWIELANVTTQRGEDGLAVLARMSKELPDDAQAQITYADELASRGKYAEAVAHLEEVLPDSPAPAETLVALVQLHLGAGDHDAAKVPLGRLRSEFADSGPADQAEANLAMAEGRVGDAIVALERWTGREETVTGFFLLANARLRSGNPRGALDAIDRALSLKDQPWPDLQRLRGKILVRLGEHRSALQAFSRARSGGGPIPVAFLPDLALALYAVGKPDEARNALERAIASESPPPTALLLFAREEGKRDPKAARAALEKGSQLYPGSLAFVAGLAAADLREKKPEAALARVRGAAAAAADVPEAQLLLVRTLIAQNLEEEAVAEIERIQERWPGQPGVAELYLDVMTFVGRGDDAFASFSRKHAEGQLPATGRVLLARLHSARGEDEQAIKLLRSALEELPDLPAAANDLAYLLARRGEDLQEATELAQEARASRPDAPEIADTLGYVYMRRNLAEAALVQFDAAVELSAPESPAWATAQFHRGLALRELGRQDEAVTALEQSLASGADFAEVKDAHRALAELANTPKAGAEEGS